MEKTLIQVKGTYYPTEAHLHDINKWKAQQHMLERALTYVTKWGTCIDGGAFVGNWSKAFTEYFDRVYAFEPLEANVRCIMENAPKAIVVPQALTNRPRFRQLGVKLGNFATMQKEGEAVFCTSIDSFEYKDLGLIKLDVEGHELAVLEGAIRTLVRHEPVLVVEVKFNDEKIRKWLAEFGYTFREGNELDEIWCFGESDED
jgi:FkbM family methyltransferase